MRNSFFSLYYIFKFNYFSIGDIIVDKWLPYGARAERRTIVQRAPPLAQYNPPRNVIINYEGPKACIIRQIHKHGVIRCDPSAYRQQYSGQLLDSGTLAQKASAIGISELLVSIHFFIFY